MPIRQVVLDFDGTCTRIADVHEAFIAAYRALVRREWSDKAADLWEEAERTLRAASPAAGWMLGGVPAAPAAADPYILAGEVVALITRSGRVPEPLPAEKAGTWYKRAYHDHPAPWRGEVRGLLEGLVAAGVRVSFVSNSATSALRARLPDLGLEPELLDQIGVFGDAAKFRVQELTFENPPAPALAARFLGLPASAPSELPRPIYLRRGAYFEALCRVWTWAAGAPTTPEETLVVGDVWELDLAMPAALGARVHLVARPEPYATYAYEQAAVEALGEAGGLAADLTGVLARVTATA
jgi:phosphoglycolate phosphatase-like HAD superfamily hydrolase